MKLAEEIVNELPRSNNSFSHIHDEEVLKSLIEFKNHVIEEIAKEHSKYIFNNISDSRDFILSFKEVL